MKRLVSSTALFLLAASGLALATDNGTRVETPCPFSDCSAAIGFTYLGEFTLPTGTMHDGVEFGGVSGLDFDKASGHYVAISDDRSEKAPARIYDLAIDIDEKGIHGVEILKTVTLLDQEGAAFAPKSVDPESVRLAPDGRIYWSSEGDAKAGLAPFVRVAGLDGRFMREFKLPEGFAPARDQSSGIRNNLAFESLTVLPSGDVLAGLESALYQDGPASSLVTGSLARVIRYDAQSGEPKAQYVYPVSPIPQAAGKPDGWNDNGMPEMLALDDHRALAIERGYAQDIGNTIRIFMVDFAGATDVSAIPSLSATKDRVVPMRKTQVLDLGAIGLKPDNIEAMTFATGKNGEELLVLASDNNFSASQKSQFFAFRVDRRPK